jgi:YtxH-like protein
MRIEKMLQGYELEDALRLIGLARRRSGLAMLLPAAGLLAVGAAVGAAIGLALAPSSGRQLREGVTGRLDQIRDKVKKDAEKHSHTNATSTPAST